MKKDPPSTMRANLRTTLRYAESEILLGLLSFCVWSTAVLDPTLDLDKLHRALEAPASSRIIVTNIRG